LTTALIGRLCRIVERCF